MYICTYFHFAFGIFQETLKVVGKVLSLEMENMLHILGKNQELPSNWQLFCNIIDLTHNNASILSFPLAKYVCSWYSFFPMMMILP